VTAWEHSQSTLINKSRQPLSWLVHTLEHMKASTLHAANWGKFTDFLD